MIGEWSSPRTGMYITHCCGTVLTDRLLYAQVLGPFPIHAREQHFLSPSYPLDREYILFRYIPNHSKLS